MATKYKYTHARSIKCTIAYEIAEKVMIVDTGKCILVTYCEF